MALSASALGANVDFVDCTSRRRRISASTRTSCSRRTRVQTRDVSTASDTLPIQLRLFLGGATSVRSYYEGELGPSDRTKIRSAASPRCSRRSSCASACGGPSRRGFLRRRNRRRGLVRLLEQVRPRIGVGLRYYFPMGPVRLDVAYNFGARFASDSTSPCTSRSGSASEARRPEKTDCARTAGLSRLGDSGMRDRSELADAARGLRRAPVRDGILRSDHVEPARAAVQGSPGRQATIGATPGGPAAI